MQEQRVAPGRLVEAVRDHLVLDRDVQLERIPLRKKSCLGQSYKSVTIVNFNATVVVTINIAYTTVVLKAILLSVQLWSDNFLV